MPIVLPLAGSTTVVKIMNLAAMDAGILGNGQTLEGEDSETIFDTFLQLVAQWRTSELEVYCQRQIIVPATGAMTYTIGPGATVNTERPTHITAAAWRNGTLPADLVYQLRVMVNLEDWQKLTTQALQAWPSAVLYEPTFPMGTLYVWPQTSGGQFELIDKYPLPTYASIGDDLLLPPEYEAPLRFNLAVWIAAAFSTPLRPDIERLASRTLRVLKRSNTRVRNLQMPAGVPSGQGIGRLNIIDNQYSR